MLLTEWDEYRDLDPARTAGLVAAARMIDGRNVLDPRQWRDAGWEISSLGRAAALPATRLPEREPALA
ncbi:hypothetical protein H3H54_01185 [Brachybacterium sp. Z12]|nr:hypothetical protein H3H54_01185 [Brachybacterium sp. Z12]